MFTLEALLPLLPFALGALIIAVLVSFALIIRLEIRLKRLFSNGDGKSVEGTLHGIINRTRQLEEFQGVASQSIAALDNRVHGSIRGTATVRFDAFEGDGSGGKQSFVTAAISEKGDGFILSSMHARSNTRIFGKSVRNFASEHELTEEERRAVEKARGQITS